MNITENPEQEKVNEHPENNEKHVTAETEENTTPVDEKTEEAASSEIPVDSWEEKYKELNDKYLRLYSEFDNYKRRTIKERLDLYKSAGEETVVSLLTVIDDLERAIISNEKIEDAKALNEGVKLIYSKLKTILGQKGLEFMDSAGKEFNTDHHEAITKIPAPSKKLKGKVVDVVEKGYLFRGKVIRYAKVVVGE